MFTHRRSLDLVALLVVVLTMLAACGPTAAPVETIVTQVVKETVVVPGTPEVVEKEVTKVVQETVEKVITATPPPANLPKGTLTVAIAAPIDTLDPLMGGNVNIQNVGWTVYEGLTYLNAKQEVEPRLAESWDVVDPTTYVFHLRKGVTFQNGEPFNADAVIYSIQRLATPTFANSGQFQTIKNVEKIDDYTVKITTKSPDPLFLKRMGMNAANMYPPKYAEEAGVEGVSQKPIGTGPFMFKEWVRGEKVVFEAWPEYWGGPGIAKVQTLIWKSIPEDDARVAALETGEIDVAVSLAPTMLGPVMDNPRLRLSRALSTRVFYLMFDNVGTGKGTPIEDKRVRQALIYAIDRDAIVKAVFQGNAQVIATIIGPSQFGWNPDLAPLPYDVEKAKALLAEAGYPNGFEVSVGCPTGVYANVAEACQALVGYLNEAGVKATLQMREAGLFYNMITDHTIDPISFDGAGDRYGDPSFPVGLVLRKDSPYTTWYNDTIDNLLVAGDSTVDQSERKKIYFELQDVMLADPPCIPLWQVYNYVGVNTRVTDFAARANEMMDFRGVGLQE